jgi:hypothetical protein
MSSMEKTTNKIYSPEDIRDKVLECIEKAKTNPISESRLIEIESLNNKLLNNFIERGYHTSDDIILEDLIEVEILKSTALASNLIEFKEMLEQIRLRFGLSKEWATDLLIHENSHANVSESVDEEWVGYGAIFIKDENGELSNIQPLHISKPKIIWGPKETIVKKIQVLEAPTVYGNKLSEGDMSDIELNKHRLDKLMQKESEDEKKRDEIRSKLGLL